MSFIFRILLLAFPRAARDRIGRPLVQTLLTDCRRDGRLRPGRLLSGALDIVRAGLAERWTSVVLSPGSRVRGAGFGAGYLTDLHHVRRSLSRRKAFAATVLITLSLGIGITATVFAIVNSVLVRELPYRDPARLAFMWSKLDWIGVPRAWVAGPHIDLLNRDAKTIETVVPVRAQPFPAMVNGQPDVITGALSTANLFDVLGVAPAIGRGFVTEDEPANVAILSHAWWKRSFGGDPNIVGKTFDLGADRMEVIGVMPETFRFAVHASLGDPRTIDVWLPTRWTLATMSDGSFGFAAVVRVAPDATLAQAQAELDVIGKRLDASRYKSRGFGWHLTGVQDDLTRAAKAPMILLGVAAGLLLLVVAANMAGLMLTRHADRQREFAVRAALGAPRSALVRLVLLESTALWTMAGAVGLGLSAMALRVIGSSPSLPLPRLEEVGLDFTVIAGTMTLAFVGGLLFGLLPARNSTRHGVAASIREVGRGNSARIGRARSVLVTAEVGLAVVLVAAGTVLLRSYSALIQVDPGFSAGHTLLADLPVDEGRYPQEAQAVAMFRNVLERTRALPGVVAAGGTTSRPLSGNSDQQPVIPEGWVPPPNAESGLMTDLIRVTPEYFRAQGITMLGGRDFTWDDRADSPPVVVVDERFASRAWPGSSAIGKRMTIDGVSTAVVGVVRHARQYRYEEDDRPLIFRPYAQDVTNQLTLTIRSTSDPESLLPGLRGLVSAIDPRQPVARVTTMSRVVDLALRNRVLQLLLVGVFAVSAILLAAVGVYGVLSALVADRTREIGIRMALGADVRTVRGFVMRRMALLAGVGLVIGLATGFALSSLLDPLLFGVSPRDPGSLAITAAVVLVAALVAAWVPARRATAIDPARALKAD